jgi:hypothetical protein
MFEPALWESNKTKGQNEKRFLALSNAHPAFHLSHRAWNFYLIFV